MKRLTPVLVAVLCLCLCAPGVVAQETPENESSTTNELYDQLGDLKIETVNYDGSSFEIQAKWTGDTPESVSLTELIELDSSGSTGISIKQLRLLPGETTTVTISAEETSGTAALLVTTETSIDRGNALVIQEGTPSTREPVPFDAAMIAVGGSAVVAVLVSIALVVRMKNDEDRGKERVA